jgi:crotonobetainyl-CoA:carnitine CoA-transferase CaiB-like acyl-CoA transferase
MEELGIGYDTLVNANPSIIHASISGAQNILDFGFLC